MGGAHQLCTFSEDGGDQPATNLGMSCARIRPKGDTGSDAAVKVYVSVIFAASLNFSRLGYSNPFREIDETRWLTFECGKLVIQSRPQAFREINPL